MDSTADVDTSSLQRSRLQRIQAVCGEVEIELDPNSTLTERTWTAVVSSRLGSETALHAEVCRFLARSMLDCRDRRSALLVAEGSAAAPWAFRAADLFGVDVIGLSANANPGRRRVQGAHQQAEKANAERVVCRGGVQLSRDAAIIALADRVDAIYVRPRGTIEDCLHRRLKSWRDASTRVAVIHSRQSAARALIDQGAVGWYLNRSRSPEPHCASVDAEDLPRTDPDWTRSDGQWLVHCTRACPGPWPGQTEHQYRDAMLLGNERGPRTPLDSLKRILRSGRLIAGAITSAHAWPVVCFSAAPLRELLDQRCFRPHLKRWDYEPYGVAIDRNAAIQLGIQPVIYGEPDQRQQFHEQDQFRFQATGNTYDWRREREWRSPRTVDLQRLGPRAVRVFVPSAAEAAMLAARFPYRVDVVSL